MIIGFTGEMGAGKTTLAKLMVQRNDYIKLAFASRFKEAMCILFGWDLEQMDNYAYKNDIDPMTMRIRRDLMQEFATGYIREKIDPLYHTHRVSLDTAIVLRTNYGKLIVYDDVRHHDEVEFIKSIGGIIVMIVRDNNPFKQSDHKSEKYDLPVNVAIYNNGTIDEMYRALCKLNIMSRTEARAKIVVDSGFKTHQYIKDWGYFG